MNKGNLFDMIDGCASLRYNDLKGEFAALKKAYHSDKNLSCLPHDSADIIDSPPSATTMAICMTIDGGRFSYLSSDDQETFLSLIREARRKMLEFYAKDENINTILQACETEPEF